MNQAIPVKIIGRSTCVEVWMRGGMPVLENATPVHEYELNTWGPADADQIVAANGRWHNP